VALIVGLLLALSMILTACSGAAAPAKTEAPASETKASDLKVGVVCSAAGQNDTGYNKAIVDKVKQLSAEFGFHAQIVEPTSGVANALETLAAESYNLVF